MTPQYCRKLGTIGQSYRRQKLRKLLMITTTSTLMKPLTQVIFANCGKLPASKTLVTSGTLLSGKSFAMTIWRQKCCL